MKLADCAAALAAGDRIVLRAIGDVAFIDLNEVFEKRWMSM
jgi:hypothetical protein